MRMGNSVIRVTDLKVAGSKLEIDLDWSKDINKYFLTDRFYIEYEKDITNVGKSILYIPIVSNIITAAWAIGADIFVEELDETFLNSLNKIKTVYKQWYPQFSFSTNIDVKDIVSNQFKGDGFGLFFSGGVDSLASFIRHKAKSPDLFVVWGADIPLSEDIFWAKIKSRIISFANREGVKVDFIKTNMQQVLNQGLLARNFGLKGWWGPVAHGLMLLGLGAPLTVINRIGTIFIASTHTKDFKASWGSHPSIDNNVQWADVHILHDGYDLSRHEKIRYLTLHQDYLPYLRACYSSRAYFNCGHCEKCLRTMTALILEGVNPANYSFNININEKFYLNVKNCFLKGRLRLGEDEVFMWTDIQNHIPEELKNDLHGSKEFFRWFRKFDLSKYKTNNLQRFLWINKYRIKEEGLVKTLKRAST